MAVVVRRVPVGLPGAGARPTVDRRASRACSSLVPAGSRWCTSPARRTSTQLVLFTLALVWAADTGAFFAGPAVRPRAARAARVAEARPGKACSAVFCASAVVAWLAASWWFIVDVWPFVFRCVSRSPRCPSWAISPRACSSASSGLKDSGSAVSRARRHARSHRQRHGRGAGARASRCIGHRRSCAMIGRRRSWVPPARSAKHARCASRAIPTASASSRSARTATPRSSPSSVVQLRCRVSRRSRTSAAARARTSDLRARGVADARARAARQALDRNRAPARSR